jgi:hypothetical protein
VLRNEPQQLTPKQHIDRVTTLHRMDMQRGALHFLYWAYGFMLASTMLIIFLQGFRVRGSTWMALF